jgi:hypothetical protein
MQLTKLIFPLFAILPLMAVSQVLVDTSLLNNSDKWKPKINGFVIANALHKVSIGPLETVKIEKGKKEVTSSKSKSLKGESGAWGIVKTYNTSKKQPFDLTVLYNSKDSVFITMNMTTETEGKRTVFKLSKKEMPDAATTWTYCEGTTLRTQNDTTEWYLESNIERQSFSDAPNYTLTSSKNDTILIYAAKGFRNKVYKLSPPEGFVLLHQGGQIAAYQSAPRFFWVRNNLDEKAKQIIGGAVISILAINNSFY